MMISAVVLTKNSEKTINQCIKSLLWCDEIVIIDDYSKDATLDAVKKYKKVLVFQRNLDNDFGSQRNFGLEKVKGDWVLFIDSDEVITDKLQKELKTTLSNTKGTSGFYLKRNDFFQNKWLKYGEVGNTHLLRLAKKNKGQWVRRVHEVWKINGKTERLTHPILHYPHPTIADFLKEINFYSSLHAKDAFEEGERTNFFLILAKPKLKFFVNYIALLGLLDGVEGLIYAIMMSFHSFLAQSKLWQLQQKQSNT